MEIDKKERLTARGGYYRYALLHGRTFAVGKPAMLLPRLVLVVEPQLSGLLTYLPYHNKKSPQKQAFLLW